MDKKIALTQKQRIFTEAYLDTGNATEAAVRAYKPKNRNTAHTIGSENLRKPTIKAFLNEKADDAVAMVYKLSQTAKNEAVRLNASKDILDRAGHFVDKTKHPNQVAKVVIGWKDSPAIIHLPKRKDGTEVETTE